jgi:hypothetical protein
VSSQPRIHWLPHHEADRWPSSTDEVTDVWRNKSIRPICLHYMVLNAKQWQVQQHESYVWCGSIGAQTVPGTLNGRHAGADSYHSRLILIGRSPVWAGTAQFRKRLCWSSIKCYWHKKCELSMIAYFLFFVFNVLTKKKN